MKAFFNKQWEEQKGLNLRPLACPNVTTYSHGNMYWIKIIFLNCTYEELLPIAVINCNTNRKYSLRSITVSMYATIHSAHVELSLILTKTPNSCYFRMYHYVTGIIHFSNCKNLSSSDFTSNVLILCL
jgi:hypothetical protein